jgi:hypothetical protein
MANADASMSIDRFVRSALAIGALARTSQGSPAHGSLITLASIARTHRLALRGDAPDDCADSLLDAAIVHARHTNGGT